MERSKANKIFYMLLGAVFLSWPLQLLLPHFRVAGVSLINVLGGVAAIALVAHIYFILGPAEREARDKRNGRK